MIIDRGDYYWTYKRKAAVVARIEAGELEAEDACRHYDLSIEELDEWRRRFAEGGAQALRTNPARGKKKGGAEPPKFREET